MKVRHRNRIVLSFSHLKRPIRVTLLAAHIFVTSASILDEYTMRTFLRASLISVITIVTLTNCPTFNSFLFCFFFCHDHAYSITISCPSFRHFISVSWSSINILSVLQINLIVPPFLDFLFCLLPWERYQCKARISPLLPISSSVLISLSTSKSPDSILRRPRSASLRRGSTC